MNRFCRKAVSSLLCAFCLTAFFSSQASAALTPLNDDTEFVKQVYLDFLNRQPDLDGLNYWVGELEAAKVDRSQLVEQYLTSVEFGETVSPVVRLYFTYYQRIPDYTGLMFWVNSFAVGMSLNDISDAFADAQEFIDRYGSLTAEEFVSKMYINVYGRQPDAGGLTYWTNILEMATLTRGQVMVEFSSAPEYLSISASQVYVTMTYMGLLRRAPEQEGFDYWAGIMDRGASGLALIDSFLLSDEYAGRFDVNVDDDGDGYTENQGDCSDLDANTYPGATEICGDGVDQDCNGVDLLCPSDIDNDGDGYTENQGDCNDTFADINPGATDICGDGIDQDCNGSDLSCPVAGIVGTWTVSEYTGPNTCGEPTGAFVDSYNVVVQDSGLFSLRNLSFNGVINGNTISWTGNYSYAEAGGTTTVTSASLTTSNDGRSLSGFYGWSWTGDGFSCSGTSTITGSRSN